MKNFIFYFFYVQMKKSIFLFGLIITTVCLSACGSKNFNMSFEEALEIANHSALQDILAENDNFEQTFDISGQLDTNGTKVDANISSNSKQDTNNKTSESSSKFNANITYSGETIQIN
jgi:outer membrane lipopolysaccharide assembly protein LptE/RlpB